MWASCCHWVVSRVIVAADRPAPLPKNCVNAGPKSEVDSPCRYSSGNTSATRGDLRDYAGRMAEENRLRCPVDSSTRLSLTRGAAPTPPHSDPQGRSRRPCRCLKPHPRETFGCGPPRDLPHSR